ncbi:hypothetical protein TCAL_10837 [Tigriopus californicus]|uniref:E3 ubiquitin-protein ligase n=1 Tax=Tigriopus californicus TaxID=6832 RepID=A0A553P002_TIGCA|nr:E3 ubiquitin-protein ligase rnf146-like [Tigriopus californicus]TRY71020.1 hypothetical protein TCAL_10837 [Tigriopus californicus]
MASVGGGNNDSSSNSRVHGSEASGGSSCCPPSSPPSPSSPLKSKKALECAVCLQTCVHPVQLDCSHIFCFLCVKGVALQSRRCPMCRGDIPPTFLDNPKLLEPLNKTDVGHDSPEIEQEHNSANEDATTENLSDSEDDNGHVDHPLHSDDQEQEQSAEEQSDEDKFCWFYEGRNGWWQYDVRTSQELESFHQNGAVTCELLIAGFLYTIDFRSMVQFRRNEPNRRRQIKRDLATISKKGIAGLRLHNNGQHSTLSTSQSLVGPSSTSGHLPHSTTNPLLSPRAQLGSQSQSQRSFGLGARPTRASPSQNHHTTFQRDAQTRAMGQLPPPDSSDSDDDVRQSTRRLGDLSIDPGDPDDQDGDY